VGVAHVRAARGRREAASEALSRARPARAAARLALALALVTGARRASAHDVSYAHIELRWSAGRVDGRLTVHPDDAAMVLAVPEPAWFRREDFLARAGPALADSLRRRFALRADGRDLAWTLTGTRPDPEGRGVQLEFFAPLPRAVAALEVAGPVFPQVANHETFVNVFRDGGLLRQDVLTAGHRVTRVYGRGAPGALAVLRTFVPAGVHHIAIGPDHILFVLGLLLLGGGLVRLLKVVTSFTIAHSITLALASLGLVRLPGRLVEPLIALSIVFVAIETLRAQKGSLARGARPARAARVRLRARARIRIRERARRVRPAARGARVVAPGLQSRRGDRPGRDRAGHCAGAGAPRAPRATRARAHGARARRGDRCGRRLLVRPARAGPLI